VQEIVANGYHRFTGSRALLRKRPLPRSEEEQTDA